ncbi:MAG: hypothetical protein AAFQ61_14030 [Cyanobacteria bacterium J06626_23]
MNASYRLKASELNEQFLESLKAIFQDQEIEIMVYPVDETAYLLESEVNRNRLLTAKANVESGTNLVEVPLESLE